MIRHRIKTTKPIGMVGKMKYANAPALQFGTTALIAEVKKSAIPKTCKLISGATGNSLKLTSKQRGSYISVLVTGISSGTAATSWLSASTLKVS